MTLAEFTQSIADQDQLCLVGPLFKGVYVTSKPTIYVDGGVLSRDPRAPTSTPSISIGDGDSAQGAPMDVQLPGAKDYSDLAYALQRIPQHIQHLELIGFLGGRRDHELINLGEIHHFLKTRKFFTTLRLGESGNSAGNSIVAFSTGQLSLTIHGTFSVVVFESAMVSISGACSYSLVDPISLQAVCSRGLSNEGQGEVLLSSNGPCFVFM